MQLIWESGFDGEDEPQFTTEVVFMEHEVFNKKRILEAIAASDLAYNTTVFPDQIILEGHYTTKSIYHLIGRKIIPTPSLVTEAPPRGRSIEKLISPYL
jgi:hypothetical protein